MGLFDPTPTDQQQQSLQDAYSALQPSPGFQYGTVLPIKYNPTTGESGLGLPNALRSAGKGLLDLVDFSSPMYRQASGEAPMSPEGTLSLLGTTGGAGMVAGPEGEALLAGAPKVFGKSNQLTGGVKNAASWNVGNEANRVAFNPKAYAAEKADFHSKMTGMGVDPQVSQQIMKAADNMVYDQSHPINTLTDAIQALQARAGSIPRGDVTPVSATLNSGLIPSKSVPAMDWGVQGPYASYNGPQQFQAQSVEYLKDAPQFPRSAVTVKPSRRYD